jgi:hypothetical protein
LALGFESLTFAGSLDRLVKCRECAGEGQHRWKTVAADRVDVPSYVLKELMRYIDVNIVTKKSSLSFGGRRQG